MESSLTSKPWFAFLVQWFVLGIVMWQSKNYNKIIKINANSKFQRLMPSCCAISKFQKYKGHANSRFEKYKGPVNFSISCISVYYRIDTWLNTHFISHLSSLAGAYLSFLVSQKAPSALKREGGSSKGNFNHDHK